MTLPKDLEGRLRDTKTFNYNVYGGVDAFDNSISFEEALDEIATLIEAYTEDRLREFAKWLGEGEFDPQTDKDNVDYFLEESAPKQLKSKEQN